MKTTITILIVFIFSIICSGQSELPKYASSKDAVLKKVKLDMPLEGRKYKNGKGYSLNPKLLIEMPKKMALVSFWSFDPGLTKTQQWTTRTETKGYYYNTITTTSHTKVDKRNAKGSSGELTLGYYSQSSGQMIEAFGSYA